MSKRAVSWTTMLAVASFVLLTSSRASAQVSAEESAKKLKPAPGLEATLWASEPMVINPTNMDIDSRGRVWITEGLNYRLTHGAGKNFPRIEDSDKIKILEDTDGDGKADKMTVFADKIFPVPMGLAVEENWSKEGKYLGCKVYVGNSPDLLVFEDTDGDDKADKKTVLLTGFGGIDSDHGVHGMVLGMDGKLYFTHGDGCCSYEQDHSHRERNFNVTDKSGRHVWSDQLANTLRCNRDGTQFEIIADRQRNNYETCLNSFGNIFTSDNDDDGNRGSRVIWVMEGGKYGYRTPGSPRHWGEDVPGNVPKLVGTGNGSPCGVMVYEGDLLPKEYQGAVLEAEAGPRQINYFPLTRKGASFRTEYKIMLSSDDQWFRPVDVTAAPDGSVFVADWYDGGVGGHGFRDQTTGRIYRVAPTGVKTKKVVPDFASFEGLISALKSPVIAARDAARRGLVAQGPMIEKELRVASQASDPMVMARFLWIASELSRAGLRSEIEQAGKREGSPLQKVDPRIREMLVRIFGRDVSRVGKVEPTVPLPPPTASESLGVLELFVADSDAGVRRELILAFRDMPTTQVGEALKKLASSWDGQDRWYLEALGLALRNREGAYLREVFDGKLFGEMNPEELGRISNVALPPYFPVDRNEAFIATHDPELAPANALSKTLGLAWEVHRLEVLGELTRLFPYLKAPELQQAHDDVIQQITDPAAAITLSDQAVDDKDPARRRQIFGALARKLDTSWNSQRDNPQVVRAIEFALADPEAMVQGVQMAAATGDSDYAKPLTAIVEDTKKADEIRALAVEAIAKIKAPNAAKILDDLIAKSKEKKDGGLIAEAAVRSLPKLGDARLALSTIMNDSGYRLGVRREALRTLASLKEGAEQLLTMAREKKLPEELKTQAASVLRSHPDRSIRESAATAMPIVSASGQPLPSNVELIRRDGDAERGKQVFLKTGTNACATCHRVQGRGQWIGPDLSQIGSKYGKDELLRSILNPNEAIGYNFRSMVVAMNDGQTLTGLVVEDSPERLILKTSEGKRLEVKPREIESRSFSDVSLMPEGLAQSMQVQELVDLLAYLSTMKQPVSIVGQFSVLGPVPGNLDVRSPIDLSKKIDTSRPVELRDGKSLVWRRQNATAEGLVDLVPTLGADSSNAAYLFTPVTSPIEQETTLVLDTKSEIQAWLDGKPLKLAAASDGEPRSIAVKLPKRSIDLVIRIPGGNASSLVATFVANQPVEFSLSEEKR